jgi:hypothetical protein
VWTPLGPADLPGTEGQRIKEMDPSHVGVFANDLYQVTVSCFDTGWGPITHLSIVRRDRSPTHDWRDLQRIKNELCGPEREAVELYPAESRLVDTNNQYHLWVLPEGGVLPLGYAERDVSDVAFGAHKQRPFDDVPDDLNARRDLAPGASVRLLVPPSPGDDE